MKTMKTIKGEQAIKLIEGAEAIIIMDSNMVLTYPSIEGDEEFANIDCGYTDSEGIEYLYPFKIWNDDNIEIENNCILLLDGDEGEYIPIKLLEITKLEI